MYCKLFASLYQGTLRGHSHEILVFTNLLATCDKEGMVDKHYRAIAEEVGLTIEEVKASILILESPDPESRSHELDGARIVRMDEHREWGWKIVNYLKYRAIREEDDRREQNRISQQRFREKRDSKQSKQSKPPSAEVSPGNPMQKQKQQAEEKKKAPSSLFISEEEFLASLKTNPAYQGISLDGELAKMDAWLLTRPGRRKTRKFVVAWLNRIDAPLCSKPKVIYNNI